MHMKTEFRGFTSALWERSVRGAAAQASGGWPRCGRGQVRRANAPSGICFSTMWLRVMSMFGYHRITRTRRVAVFPSFTCTMARTCSILEPLSLGWIGGIDEAMRDLTAARRARAAIIVGIWNTSQRSQEYMASASARDAPGAVQK